MPFSYANPWLSIWMHDSLIGLLRTPIIFNSRRPKESKICQYVLPACSLYFCALTRLVSMYLLFLHVMFRFLVSF